MLYHTLSQFLPAERTTTLDTAPPPDRWKRLTAIDFAHRLTAVRRQRGMPQRTLADIVGLHVTQLRRFETGVNQPTLDVLRALAVALGISANGLVFGAGERGPEDLSLRLQLAARDQLDPDEPNSIRAFIGSALVRLPIQRLAQTS